MCQIILPWQFSAFKGPQIGWFTLINIYPCNEHISNSSWQVFSIWLHEVALLCGTRTQHPWLQSWWTWELNGQVVSYAYGKSLVNIYHGSRGPGFDSNPSLCDIALNSWGNNVHVQVNHNVNVVVYGRDPSLVLTMFQFTQGHWPTYLSSVDHFSYACIGSTGSTISAQCL